MIEVIAFPEGAKRHNSYPTPTKNLDTKYVDSIEEGKKRKQGIGIQ